MEQNGTDKVKSLEKAIMVLDLVRVSEVPLGVNDISRQCGLNVTTVFRMLRTLKASGWVYQYADDKYGIGPKVSFVHEKNNFYTALSEIAWYTMRSLSQKTSQAMNLAVRVYNQAYILQQSRTSRIVDYVPPIGTYLPLYASATGKLLMADLPESLLELILDSIDFRPLTPYTITNRAMLLSELDKCRAEGFAQDARESQEDGFCIAVPVRLEGLTVAALSFSGIIGRIQEDKVVEYRLLLSQASSEIERNLRRIDGDKLLKRTSLKENT